MRWAEEEVGRKKGEKEERENTGEEMNEGVEEGNGGQWLNEKIRRVAYNERVRGALSLSRVETG